MAKKAEQDTLADMFVRMGRDLSLPQMDVDTIVDHHRRNLDALQKSAETMANGTQTALTRQLQVLDETLREITRLADGYRNAAGPDEVMARQAEFVQRSFETALRNAGEMGELVRKSGEDTVKVLRARIREGMKDIAAERTERE